MKRYRYFCRNCFEKEGKEVAEIMKVIKGFITLAIIKVTSGYKFQTAAYRTDFS